MECIGHVAPFVLARRRAPLRRGPRLRRECADRPGGHDAKNGLPRSGGRQILPAMKGTSYRTGCSSWQHRRAGSILALASAFVAIPALGASRDAKEKAARTACLAGDYTKGVTLLSELFVETKDPNWIFNSGRCFEQNARFQEAISRFQEYLRVAKHQPDEERADAQKHIDDCQDNLAKQSPRPLGPVVEQPAAPAARPESSAMVSTTAAGKPAMEPGSGLGVAGITIAAVGGAALVAGIVFNLKANSLASDLKKTDGYTSDKESSRKTYQTLGWVGYGVGAACVATGGGAVVRSAPTSRRIRGMGERTEGSPVRLLLCSRVDLVPALHRSICGDGCSSARWTDLL
jgi:hypothetical protein